MKEQTISSHLHDIIDCLQQQEHHLSPHKNSPQNLSALYQTTNNFLDQIQDHFNRCKKYNQAKIHRKYEIIMTDLAKQNRYLKAKIQLQTRSRPSSQKYVSDLIAKMVELRNSNDQLNNENEYLKNTIERIEKAHQPPNSQYTTEIKTSSQTKQFMKKQWQRILIKDTINLFFKLKKEQITSQSMKITTNFTKFLRFNQKKADRWYLIDLFHHVQKWTSHMKDTRFLDKSKIKDKIEESLSLSRQKQSKSIEKIQKTVASMKKTITNTSAFSSNRQNNSIINSKKLNALKNQNFKFYSLYRSERKIDQESQSID